MYIKCLYSSYLKVKKKEFSNIKSNSFQRTPRMYSTQTVLTKKHAIKIH